jgi:hypothetical protein
MGLFECPTCFTPASARQAASPAHAEQPEGGRPKDSESTLMSVGQPEVSSSGESDSVPPTAPPVWPLTVPAGIPAGLEVSGNDCSSANAGVARAEQEVADVGDMVFAGLLDDYAQAVSRCSDHPPGSAELAAEHIEVDRAEKAVTAAFRNAGASSVEAVIRSRVEAMTAAHFGSVTYAYMNASVTASEALRDAQAIVLRALLGARTQQEEKP